MLKGVEDILAPVKSFSWRPTGRCSVCRVQRDSLPACGPQAHLLGSGMHVGVEGAHLPVSRSADS